MIKGSSDCNILHGCLETNYNLSGIPSDHVIMKSQKLQIGDVGDVGDDSMERWFFWTELILQCANGHGDAATLCSFPLRSWQLALVESSAWRAGDIDPPYPLVMTNSQLLAWWFSHQLCQRLPEGTSSSNSVRMTSDSTNNSDFRFLGLRWSS